MLSLGGITPGNDQGQGRNTEIRTGPRLGELQVYNGNGRLQKFAFLYYQLTIDRGPRARWESGISGSTPPKTSERQGTSAMSTHKDGSTVYFSKELPTPPPLIDTF